MPVAQAFDNWLQTNDQKLPWVDQSRIPFRTTDVARNYIIQFSSLSRDK